MSNLVFVLDTNKRPINPVTVMHSETGVFTPLLSLLMSKVRGLSEQTR